MESHRTLRTIRDLFGLLFWSRAWRIRRSLDFDISDFSWRIRSPFVAELEMLQNDSIWKRLFLENHPDCIEEIYQDRFRGRFVMKDISSLLKNICVIGLLSRRQSSVSHVFARVRFVYLSLRVSELSSDRLGWIKMNSFSFEISFTEVPDSQQIVCKFHSISEMVNCANIFANDAISPDFVPEKCQHIIMIKSNKGKVLIYVDDKHKYTLWNQMLFESMLRNEMDW
jgi:hypothetical protein